MEVAIAIGAYLLGFGLDSIWDVASSLQPELVAALSTGSAVTATQGWRAFRKWKSDRHLLSRLDDLREIFKKDASLHAKFNRIMETREIITSRKLAKKLAGLLEEYHEQ